MISHCQLIHSTLTELFSLRNSPGGKSSRRSEGGNLQFKILFEMKLKMVLELYLRKHSRLILFFLAYILIYQRKTELFSSLFFKASTILYIQCTTTTNNNQHTLTIKTSGPSLQTLLRMSSLSDEPSTISTIFLQSFTALFISIQLHTLIFVYIRTVYSVFLVTMLSSECHKMH